MIRTMVWWSVTKEIKWKMAVKGEVVGKVLSLLLHF